MKRPLDTRPCVSLRAEAAPRMPATRRLRRSARRTCAGLVGATVLALLWPAACTTDPEPAVEACFAGNEAHYARYEGPDPDSCESDANCIISGCSSEVCAAQSLATTCDVIPTPRRDYGCDSCACLAGSCRWVREAH
jgi:hypothetical protein